MEANPEMASILLPPRIASHSECLGESAHNRRIPPTVAKATGRALDTRTPGTQLVKEGRPYSGTSLDAPAGTNSFFFW